MARRSSSLSFPLALSAVVIAAVFVACAALVPIGNASSIAATTPSPGEADNSDAGEPSSRCGLYLAPSSTTDDADGVLRLGLYAGRDYRSGDPIGPPEIALQIYDFRDHRRRAKGPDYSAFALSQMWTPDSTGAKYDTNGEWREGPGTVYTMIPGVGSVGNLFPGYSNADWDQRWALRRTVMTDDASARRDGSGPDDGDGGSYPPSPGWGASSEYYNVSLAATRDIVAGMEVFMDFGTDWSMEHERDGQVTATDHDRADVVVNKVLSFLEKHKEIITPDLSEEIYSFLTEEVITVGSENKKKGFLLRGLLPESYTGLEAMRDAGGSLAFHNPDVLRNLKWLEENGQCVDNLRADPSTVPHAGRGAFATRRMRKGEIVAPVPLAHIPRRSDLDMYDLEIVLDDDGDEVLRHRSGGDRRPLTSQLLLNYCFGHPESGMLLYPFGVVINFVNHKSSTEGGANVEIKWSDPDGRGGSDGERKKDPPRLGNVHHPEWLEVSPSDMHGPEYEKIGLSFDLVATRDIEMGEEVFLDYGPEWDVAWESHVRTYRVGDKDGGEGTQEEHFDLTALEMNDRYRGSRRHGVIMPFKTKEERDERAYPPGVTTACHAAFDSTAEKKDDDEYLYGGSRVYSWSRTASDVGGINGANLRLCRILKRQEVEAAENGAGVGRDNRSYNYTASVQMEMLEDETSDSVLVGDIPHEAIQFVDRPYMGAQHWAGAFRHFIGMPDSIFPEAWRDQRRKVEKGG